MERYLIHGAVVHRQATHISTDISPSIWTWYCVACQWFTALCIKCSSIWKQVMEIYRQSRNRLYWRDAHAYRMQYIAHPYLGIWLDERLGFNIHIENLLKKLRPKLGFLFRIKKCFPFEAKKRIIQSCFLSVLNYGDVVYMHANLSLLKKLVYTVSCCNTICDKYIFTFPSKWLVGPPCTKGEKCTYYYLLPRHY